MEIKEMTMEQVDARMAEIDTELNGENVDIEALNAEVDELVARKQAIIQEAAEKRALLDKVANSTVEPIAKIEEDRNDKMENI